MNTFNTFAKLIFVACALLLSGELAAQTFKCKDAAGKITYSDRECSKSGLKDAGEVKDRLNISPAYRPSESTPESRSRAPAVAPEAPKTDAPAATTEPPHPERRCFVVHTPQGGTVTRCNDKPEA